jgi:DNA-binding phage protein
MPIRDYKETIGQRVKNDPAFKKVLLEDALECLLSGDVDTGKAVLKDYIKATSGFENLSKNIDKKPESLIRMLGPKGNPTANNLFKIISQIQENEKIKFQITVVN